MRQAESLRGAGDKDEEPLKALDAVNAGKTPREVAIILYSADEVAENWYSDGGLRAKAKRRIAKARELMKGGYKALAARL